MRRRVIKKNLRHGEDLYEVLGLAEDADEASIKKAQLMACHAFLGKALKGDDVFLGLVSLYHGRCIASSRFSCLPAGKAW